MFRGFKAHSFLPYYYAIKGKRKDGYTHVLYLNGGHPTWGILDYVKLAGVTLCSLSPHRYLSIFPFLNVLTSHAHRVLVRMCSKLNWLGALPKLRRIAHSSQALFS